MVNLSKYKFPDIFEVHIVKKDPKDHNFSMSLSGPVDTNIDPSLILLNNLFMELHKDPIRDCFKNNIESCDMGSLVLREKRETRFHKLLEKKNKRSKSEQEIFLSLIQEKNLFGVKEGKYIITNPKISTYIQENRHYNVYHKEERNFPLERIGRLMNLDVYCDSFMKFDDDKLVILEDRIKLFVSDPILKTIESGIYSPRILVSMYRSYSIPDTRVMDFTDTKFKLY